MHCDHALPAKCSWWIVSARFSSDVTSLLSNAETCEKCRQGSIKSNIENFQNDCALYPWISLLTFSMSSLLLVWPAMPALWWLNTGLDLQSNERRRCAILMPPVSFPSTLMEELEYSWCESTIPCLSTVYLHYLFMGNVNILTKCMALEYLEYSR